MLPRLVQVAAGQEARDGVPRQVVHPPLCAQLVHDCIDPRVARASMLPCVDPLGHVIPRDLLADGVAHHAVEVWREDALNVEELAPQQLADERDGRLGVGLVPGEHVL